MAITLDNFEYHVPFKIWQRGMDYYDDDAVIDLDEMAPGEWVATVEGTDEYLVELSLKGREVQSWSCECPYDGGDICKHVVAVVLAIRDKMKNINKPKAKEVTLEELMKCAKPEDYQNLF